MRRRQLTAANAVQFLDDFITTQDFPWGAATFGEAPFWAFNFERWWWIVENIGDLCVFVDPASEPVDLKGCFETCDPFWLQPTFLPWWGASSADWARSAIAALLDGRAPDSRVYPQSPPEPEWVWHSRHTIEGSSILAYTSLEQPLPGGAPRAVAPLDASTRFQLAAEGETLADGIPFHLSPEGPFVSSLSKRRPVTPTMLAKHRLLQTKRERLLTDEHLQTIDHWSTAQNIDDPTARQAAKCFETQMYLRQVAAKAIVDDDDSAFDRLVRMLLLTGVGETDRREQPWRQLRYAWQVAVATTPEPEAYLREAIARHHPPTADVLDETVGYLRRIRDLAVTDYPATSLPTSSISLLEPEWDPEHHAERVRLTARLDGDLRLPEPPWTVPTDGYIDDRTADQHAAAGAQQPNLDSINRFLMTGSQEDATEALASGSGLTNAVEAAAWVAQFWAGPDWPARYPIVAEVHPASEAAVPNGLVAVARNGWAQLARRASHGG